jgi:radical SAM protein with 4Fe4S-binding SPASM domain
MVLTRENLNNILRNISNVLKKFPVRHRIKANYVENIYSPELTSPEVTADELFNNLFLPIIKHLLKSKKLLEVNILTILERFFSSVLFGVNNAASKDKVSSNCASKFCAGGNNVVDVDADGVVCFCGRWDDVHNLCKLGSIYDPDPWGLFSYYKSFTLQNTKAAYMRRIGCDDCPAKNICDYGCLAFAYAKYKEIRIRKELVCAYYLKIIEYLKANCSVLLEAYALSQDWNISKDKKGFLLEVSEGKLNRVTVETVTGWSILNTKEQNLLQVILC